MLNISNKAHNALIADFRYIKAKLEIYFDGADKPPTNITSDIISIDTLDEASASSKLPFGEVSYNELTVELDNINRQYNITNASSPYAGKLVAATKVVVTYQVEVEEDVFEDIRGGTYYTDTWSANNESISATLVCYDKLFLVGDKPINRFKVRRNISVAECYRLLFEAAGFKPSDYNIDTSVTGSLGMFWGAGITLNECLCSLALASATNVYVDKSDKIQVKSIVTNGISDLTVTDGDLIITSRSTPSYNNVYSGVNIEYDEIVPYKPEEVVRIDGIELAVGETILPNVSFSKSPVFSIASIVLKSVKGVEVANYSYVDNSITITLNNSTDSTQLADVTVTAEAVNTVKNTYFKEKTTGTNNIMPIQLPLVHNKSYINMYADSVLNAFSTYISTVELDIRAYPALEVYDKISVNSATASLDRDFTIVRMQTTYKDGLTGTLSVIVS